MMSVDPIIPSSTNKTGYRMIAEPIIVLATETIVCGEESVPVNLELFKALTLCNFYLASIC